MWYSQPLGLAFFCGFCISAGTALAFSLFLWKIFRQNRITLIAWIATAFLTYSLHNITMLTGILAPNTTYAFILFMIATFFMLLTMLSALVFVFFVEFGKIPVHHFFVALFWAGFSFGVLMVPPNIDIVWLESVEGFYPVFWFPAVIITGIFMLYIAAFFVKAFIRILREEFAKEYRKKFQFIFLGGSFLFGSYIVFNSLSYFWQNYTVAMGYIFPGIIGLWVAFYGARTKALNDFYLKQEIYRLFIFDRRSGEVLYNYHFRRVSSKMDSLIAASLSGVLSLIGEVLNIEDPLDNIEVGKRVLIVEEIGFLMVAIIVDQDTQVFRQALHSFCGAAAHLDIYNLQVLDRSRKDLDEELKKNIDQLVESVFSFFPKAAQEFQISQYLEEKLGGDQG